MRILVLLTDAFGGYGGISQFNRNLFSALCAHPACEAVVALPRLVPQSPGPLPSRLHFVTAAARGKPRFVWESLRAACAGRVDLILCGHINLWPLAVILRAMTGAPAHLVVHGLEAWAPTPSRLTNWFIGKADGFIAVSDFTRRRFCAWSGLPPERGRLLMNAVDLTAFTPGPKDEDLLQRYGFTGRTIIMTLGRLETRERFKGIDQVMEALPRLLNTFPSLAYLIVGEGSDAPRLRQKARELGLADQVVFAGKVPEERKADYFRLADAYVMPGSAEGFGIAYLEAMACGIPVVGSSLDGSGEPLRGGKLGCLVNPFDPEELVDGITRALQAPRGRPAGDLHDFSVETFVRRCHGILDDICVRRGGEAA